MANGHGGKREGAGRKGRAHELGLIKLLDECVNEDDRRKLFGVLKEKSLKGDMRAIELLLSYLYGKPKQSVDMTSGGETIITGITYIVPDGTDPQANP